MQDPLRIGHRGAKTYVAENTLASVEKALALGVDGIEIDVHRCSSGELVVFHDFTLDRMTNGTGEIANHSLDELKSLKVNQDHAIPLLEEVLDLVDGQCFLNIELKGRFTGESVVKTIQNYIRNYHWTNDQFLISSFQFKELELVRSLNEHIRLGVLTKASVTEAVQFGKRIKANAIHPNMALVSNDNVKWAQNEGLKVITWTVNNEEDILRMKTYGVDGIISDNPDRI